MKMKGNVLLAACCYSMMMSVSYGFAPFQKITTTTQLSETLDGEEIRGPITPLGNFVLVRTKDALSATAGGILLPDQVRQ